MDDLKLISLAGKAAGCEYTQSSNPLNDDALALRLAVKLRFRVDVDFDRVDVSDQFGAAAEYLYRLPSPTDPYAATRRAIVRAAAEVGRNMK
jgi:hypothetical protein